MNRRHGDLLCAAGLLTNAVAPFAFALATPALLKHHTILLEALSSNKASLVSGGILAEVGRASLVLVMLAPLVAILLTDVFFWWAGQRWGSRFTQAYAERNPRMGRWVVRADEWVLRHGVRTLAVTYFQPIPNVLVFLSCGASGMRLPVFLLGDAVGTLLWAGLLVGLGWSLGHDGLALIDSIDHDELVITIAVVIGALALALLRRGPRSGRRGRRPRPTPPAPR